MYRIAYKKDLNEQVTLMKIEAPLIAKKARPGQFIIFRIDEFGERVPLTIADTDPEAGTVTQEQIDRACSGQISCPHCGRWNSFTILERGSVPGTYPFDSEHTSVEHMEHMTKKEADTNDADSPWEEDDEL